MVDKASYHDLGVWGGGGDGKGGVSGNESGGECL